MRRKFLKEMAVATAALLSGCATTAGKRSNGHVVVVGGGFAGATVAKYLRLWSAGRVAVTLVERRKQFISCPISNLVLVGNKSLADISVGYGGLQKLGVEVINDEVSQIDSQGRSIRLAGGQRIAYDRCVLAPGVDFMLDDLPGLHSEAAQARCLHAYKAGPQTLALQAQLKAMPDGGVYALTIPKMPYVCPPGPYERASLIADYFRKHKPRAKVLILDANEELQSKKALFLAAWADAYRGIIEYRPSMELRDVDAGSNSAIFDFDKVRADVLNVIPPQRIGQIGRAAGLKLLNGRWAEVDWLTLESSSQPNIHVIGDATFSAPLMPKSGHMANQHGKVLAAALLNLLNDSAPNPAPVVMNTCYSFVSTEMAMHVSSVFAFDPEQRTFLSQPGAGGLSSQASVLEGLFAHAWSRNIWADALAAVD